MEIGQKIKQCRIKNGLTLEELAARCELTKGFLSQIERDLASPSITTLNDIVEALGMTMADFFQDEVEEKVVFTSEDYFEKVEELSTLYWIVPNAQKNMMEPILLELEPGGQSNEISPHEGEEFGYVLSGRILLYDGNRKFSVRKGQTFYISGKNTHIIKNESSAQAKLIWVCTPPIF